jgi:hypothetical protein
MAHFAELNKSNIVTQVIVVHNNELLVDGVELEAKGVEFCHSLLGGNWVQTSYNNTFRKNFAGIGYSYDPVRDAFIPPKPTNGEWVLNEITCNWELSIPYPTDGRDYEWDEATVNWIEVPTE